MRNNLARLVKRAVLITMAATTLGVTGVPILPAQEIRGIFNDADRGWQRAEINDGWRKRYAQGSVLLLHGVNLAPTTAQASGNSPLPTELGGASVRVIVGDTQLDAFLISVSSTFVRAVLPAWTPEGRGVVIVRHSGRDGFPREIEVARMVQSDSGDKRHVEEIPISKCRRRGLMLNAKVFFRLAPAGPKGDPFLLWTCPKQKSTSD